MSFEKSQKAVKSGDSHKQKSVVESVNFEDGPSDEETEAERWAGQPQ